MPKAYHRVHPSGRYNSQLTYNDVARVHLQKGNVKFPDGAECDALQSPEDREADDACRHGIGGRLIELKASPVQHLQGEQRACAIKNPRSTPASELSHPFLLHLLQTLPQKGYPLCLSLGIAFHYPGHDSRSQKTQRTTASHPSSAE